MKKLIIVILAGLLLAGCATIISGSRQTVIFSAPEGTRIFREGIKVAEIPQGETEAFVRMDRSLSGAYFVAKKEGFHDTRFYVRMRVNGVVFVNLVIPGGVIIGTIVDLATGAAAKYPNFIEIEMDPIEESVGTTRIKPERAAAPQIEAIEIDPID